MNQFVNAVRQQPDSLTENGAATFSTSLSSNVDFFFKAGASRNQAKAVAQVFQAAYRENPQLALRNLFWSRDARQGAGERELFRTIVPMLDKEILIKMVPFVPEFGRWDDLIPMIEHKDIEVASRAASVWGIAVANQDGLACKWAPRKGEVAVKLRSMWNMSPKQYRKTLVTGTSVVETAMCAKEWTSINFEHVPSVASARYRKAFEKNAGQAYIEYKDKLVKGEAKINASALFPHDVIRSVKQGGSTEAVAEAQWNSLPNFVTGGSVLCMADVSGSMETQISGSVTAMDVSIALAMYTSERLDGSFKNMFMTFSGSPSFVNLNPAESLRTRYNKTRSAQWDMNTDLNKAFRAILDLAVKNKVPESDMPKVLLILSDMEFDRCGHLTNFQALEKMYKEAGYEIPTVVFWNLASRTANSPVRFNQQGVALISGFSPSILTSVLGSEDATPEKIMLKTLMKDRYTIDGLTA